MSDLQLRDWIAAIWAKARPLPAEPADVVVGHDGRDMLLEIRGKPFAVDLIFSPAVWGLPRRLPDPGSGFGVPMWCFDQNVEVLL